MWALEVGSVEQASGPAWPDCILGRNDIWEGCLVYGFQCLQGAYEDTLWEAFTDLIMIEIRQFLHTRHCAKRLRATSQSQQVMWLWPQRAAKDFGSL